MRRIAIRSIKVLRSLHAVLVILAHAAVPLTAFDDAKLIALGFDEPCELAALLLGAFPKLGRPVHGKRNVRVLLESPVQIYYRLGPAAR